MGPLKDAFYTAAWAHLQAQPRCQTHVSDLHTSSGAALARAAWGSLQDGGAAEGFAKGTSMAEVLKQRHDVFDVQLGDDGHQVVSLTLAAQALDPNGGLPAEVNADLFDSPADASGPGSTLIEARPGEGLLPVGPLLPADQVRASLESAEERLAKMPRLGEKGAGKGNATKSRHGAVYTNQGYKDLVWTPEMQKSADTARKKMSSMAWALYKAIDSRKGEVTLSQVGSDFTVASLKKDPYFKNWKMLDMLKAWSDVFEVVPAPQAPGGYNVRLQPGAQAALPDAEERLQEAVAETAELPTRIETPHGLTEKVQALRIELVLALHRRGKRCLIQDLGQEPQLQEKKKLITSSTKKLVDWIKVFPGNFALESSGQSLAVKLLSPDTLDTRMIDQAILREAQQTRFGKGGPPSSNRPPPRRTSSPMRGGSLGFGVHPSLATFGYGAMGYGAPGVAQPAIGMVAQPAFGHPAAYGLPAHLGQPAAAVPGFPVAGQPAGYPHGFMPPGFPPAATPPPRGLH